jgi:endonuclease III
MTTHHSFNRVFNRLKTAGDWLSIRKMPLRKLRSLIKDAGLSHQKAPRIKAILRQVMKDFGKLTLDPLKAMNDTEAFLYLTALPGVGTKTAKCVMMYSLKRHVLPVDTHGLRVARRLGLVPSNTTLTDVHERLEPMIDPDDRYAFHVNVIEHGRKTCLAIRPRCDECILRPHCTYAMTHITMCSGQSWSSPKLQAANALSSPKHAASRSNIPREARRQNSL